MKSLTVNKVRRSNPEYVLAKQLAYYLRLKYPKVYFHFDLAGLNLSKAQAGMAKELQKGKGWPDLFIAESRHGHNGMFLELKKQDAKLFKKNGELASPHLQDQDEVRKILEARNYWCSFSIGFDESKKLIDWYLSENRPELIKKP